MGLPMNCATLGNTVVWETLEFEPERPKVQLSLKITKYAHCNQVEKNQFIFNRSFPLDVDLFWELDLNFGCYFSHCNNMLN